VRVFEGIQARMDENESFINQPSGSSRVAIHKYYTIQPKIHLQKQKTPEVAEHNKQTNINNLKTDFTYVSLANNAYISTKNRYI